MRTILITGGAGFIGSHLALALLERGYKVTVLDNLSPQIHGSNPEETSPLYQSIKDKVNFINGSVTSRQDWIAALKDIEYIVHLAAETGTGQSMYEINKYVHTNIGGTALLLDILTNSKTHKVKRIVAAESRAIYGEGRYRNITTGEFVYPEMRKDDDMINGRYECYDSNNQIPLELISTDENSKIHPTSVYGITKQVQGQLIHLCCNAIGIEAVTLRYQNVYGPGQSLSNPYTGILSIFSTRIKNRKEIQIFEDGKESRDFIYVDDVVDATIRAIEISEASGRVFNIGTGIPTDVMTVAKTLMKCYNQNVPLKVTGNYRLGDIRHNFADITLARKILGFSPKWTFENGIKEFTEWVNKQKTNDDKYESSIIEMKSRGLYK